MGEGSWWKKLIGGKKDSSKPTVETTSEQTAQRREVTVEGVIQNKEQQRREIFDELISAYSALDKDIKEDAKGDLGEGLFHLSSNFWEKAGRPDLAEKAEEYNGLYNEIQKLKMGEDGKGFSEGEQREEATRETKTSFSATNVGSEAYRQAKIHMLRPGTPEEAAVSQKKATEKEIGGYLRTMSYELEDLVRKIEEFQSNTLQMLQAGILDKIEGKVGVAKSFTEFEAQTIRWVKEWNKAQEYLNDEYPSTVANFPDLKSEMVKIENLIGQARSVLVGIEKMAKIEEDKEV